MSYASSLSGAARGKALSGARLLRCSGTPSKERFRGTVSRILSSLFTAERIIYLSSLTRVSVPFETRSGPLLEPPIWPCTRRGFPCPGVLTPGGGLLHHLFTLTELRAYARSPAVYSLWHFPSARLQTCCPRVSRRLRGAASCGVRTFLFHSPLRVLKAILRPSEPANIIPQSNAATTNFPTPRSPFPSGSLQADKAPPESTGTYQNTHVTTFCAAS